MLTLSLHPLSAYNETTSYPALGQMADAAGALPYRAFDAALDEFCYWVFKLPSDAAVTTWTVKLDYCMASATSGNVVLWVYVQAVSDGDSLDLDASESFDTVNASAATAVPGTAGYIDSISITLSNKDSVAAGDLVIVKVMRPGLSEAADTAPGDLRLLPSVIECV